MRTLFITIFDGAASKNVLHSNIFKILRSEYRIVLFVPGAKYEYYRQMFSEDVVIEKSPPADFPLIERWFHVLALRCLHTETVRMKIHHDVASGRGVIRSMGQLVLWWLGRSRLIHRALRFLYLQFPDSSFDAYIDTYRPRGVFVPNMISNEDYRMIKATRKRGIVSIGMPKSWDNFTSKTFFNIFPDWIMVQNHIMQEEAVRLFDYPRERIEVVGFPQFDIYADSSALVSREEFFSSVGLDPGKKTILYAAAGQQLAPYDEEVLADLITYLDREVSGVQVLVRPHPKYEFQADRIPNASFVKIDRPGRVVTGKHASWEFDMGDIRHLYNSLYHADLLISTVSTLNIEGAIFDKPLISIGYDGKQVLGLALSTARYYKYTHMLPIVRSGGMSVAYSAGELYSLVESYLENPARDRNGRARIVTDEVGRLDGHAAEKIAQLIVTKIGT